MQVRYMLFLPLIFAVMGCGGGKQSSEEISVLKQEVEKLERELSKVKSDVLKVRSDLMIASLTGPQESVIFDPQDDKTYQSVKGPAGVMLVVLEKVEPYLDGFEISMRIGNPTSAAFTGLKGQVQWGRKYDAKQDDVYNRLQEKKLDLKDYMPAGSWTIVKFNVAPAKPEEVRRIIFEPVFNSLQLRRP